MRENGIDMPDPKFEGGRVTQRDRRPGQKINPDDDAHRREGVREVPGRRSSRPSCPTRSAAEFKQAALENARCMREHGVEKFPDPTFDENGGAQIRMSKDMGIDPEDPTFQKAMKACEDKLPGAGTTSAGGGE